MVGVGTARFVLVVLFLAGSLIGGLAPASAWSGSTTGYEAKDNVAMPAGYSLEFGSGDWVANPAGAWADIDISGTGTAFALSTSTTGGANTWSPGVSMGFTFTWFGTAFTEVKAHNMGLVGFGTPGGPTNFISPMNNGAPNNVIAPIWSQSQNGGCNQAASGELSGVAPYRVYTVQFTDSRYYNGGACNQGNLNYGRNYYQVRLYETFNVAEVHYQKADNNDPYGGDDTEAGIRGKSNAEAVRYTPLITTNGRIQATDRVVQYRPTGTFPVAVADTFTMDYLGEGPTLRVPAAQGVLANDRSVASASLRAVALGGPSGGTLQAAGPGTCAGTTLGTDGGFCFTPPTVHPCGPPPSLETTYTFRYGADDAWADDGAEPFTDQAVVAVKVTNCNLPPVPEGDSFPVIEDEVNAVAAPGVLANDMDDGVPLPLTAELVAGPQNAAQFDLLADGSFTYQGAANFTGLDSFTYQAFDGAAYGGPVTVLLDVQNVNDPPVADASGVDGDEDADPGFLVQLGGTDVDPGDTVELCTVTSAPPIGTLTRQANCRYLYKPAPDFVGTTFLQHHVNDGEAQSAIAEFPIRVRPVNDRPDAGDVAVDGVEETTLEVLGTTTDKEGDATVACAVVGTPSGGVVRAVSPPCSFTFEPETDRYGAATFEYRALDAAATGTPGRVGTVTVRLADVPDLPVLLHVDASVLEDDAFGPAGFAFDPDHEQPSCLVASAPRMGRVEGTRCDALRYIPDPNRAGVDSFTYRVVDPVLGELAETGRASITVVEVNDRPHAIAGSVTVPEDVAAVFRLEGRDVETATPALQCAMVGAPLHGELTLQEGDSCQATYVPEDDFHGLDSFTFQVHDGDLASGPAHVLVMVGATNDAPLGGDLALTTLEDVPLTFAFPASDIDGTPRCDVLGGPARGHLEGPAGSCERTYVPTKDLHGNDTLRFHVADGQSASRDHWVNITVLPVPDFPAPEVDTYRLHPGRVNAVGAAHGVLGNDHHPDGLALHAGLLEGPTKGQLVLGRDGSFTYRTAEPSGKDQFVYRLTDTAGRWRDGVVHIDIHGNAPPVADFVASHAAAAVGQAVRFFDLSYDPEGGLLVHRWDLGDGTVLHTAQAERAYAKAGVYTVTLQVTDEWGAVASALQRVTVGAPAPAGEPLGEPPVADAGPDRQARAGDAVTLQAGARSGTARSFLWTQVGGPQVALEGFGAQNLSFVAPAPKGFGLEALEFELVVFDGRQASAPDRVVVFLLPQPPAGPARLTLQGPSHALPGERLVVLPMAEGFRNPVAYAWRQLGGPEVALRPSLDGSLTVTAPARPAQLVFEAVGQDGLATARQTVTVLVAPAELVTFQVQRASGGVWTFTATSPGRHVWDFGDGATAHGTTVTHRFAGEGRYLVTLDPEGEAPVHAAAVVVAGRADAPSAGSGWVALAAGLAVLGLAGSAAWWIGRRG